MNFEERWIQVLMKRVAIVLALALVLIGSACATANKEKKPIILATTTSTQDSGLLDVLVPRFEQQSGYQVKTIAVGSGEALAMGRRGEADVILSHSPDAEDQFVAEGYGVNRRAVMHNDFVLVGPPDDPAGVRGMPMTQAFATIAEKEAVFVSRGDNSGTHALEKKLWQSAGLTPSGSWYLSTGQGMGNTLRVAEQKGGYTISDRATYLAQRSELQLEILGEGDQLLLNYYHIIEVNPSKHANVNNEGARAFGDFLVSDEGQEIIRSFGVEQYGQPLFFPDAIVAKN